MQYNDISSNQMSTWHWVKNLEQFSLNYMINAEKIQATNKIFLRNICSNV